MKTIINFAKIFEEKNISYQFVGPTALAIQGIHMDVSDSIFIDIQWDSLEQVYDLFLDKLPSEIIKDVKSASFSFGYNENKVHIHCEYNTTIRTNPYRIAVEMEDAIVWCVSFYTYLYNPKADPMLAEKVHSYLLNKQNKMTEANQRAWNQNNYQALINRYGDPANAAAKIKENPEWRLHPFLNYMGDLQDKKILHLMGSNGVKGVALSLLGAKVTIVDFSAENERFAKEVAREAGVSLEYVVSDVLNLPDLIQSEAYDMVLMELGVLHYFIDLQPLFSTIHSKLSKGGIFLLHEFHPISTKLITSSGKKHKVTGNYFDPSLEEVNVAFSKHMGSEQQTELTKSLQRKWTIGEVVTSVGQNGFRITVLEEEPNHKIHDIGLPKTYTLVAAK
ncbi:class I SAM-dependent methyltransferase [Neobacillus niacini]|uniref:class I SAM-dependent methyltransferase n=1 Tax=Neobacillus niacini TaxID=86668 RepID=UPI00286318D3|nr:class I SAM-dependent methyltransferase [Neobacillus niacini]MDR6997587.1 ubiquinone/menaquinone biosynthesis C-methylase UbiE [Neobacillus niacini]